MKKKSITIVSSTEATAVDSQKQLEEYFGDTLKYNIVTISDSIPHGYICDEAIMITNRIIEPLVLPYLDPSCPYYIAERTIDTEMLEKLYDIPDGSSVIIYNVAKNIVEECLFQLETRGIQHLKMTGMYPGCSDPCPEYGYVVAFGEPVPQFLLQTNPIVIDLGSRPIDDFYFVKLAMDLGIYDAVKDKFPSVSIRKSIAHSLQYMSQIKQIQTLSAELRMILNQFDDSVVMCNSKGTILFQNDRARSLTRNFDSESQFISDLLEKQKQQKEFFYNFGGKNYYIDSFINDQTSTQVYVFIIRDVDSIRDIEKGYRASIVSSGFVAANTFSDIICESDTMHKLIVRCEQFAKRNSTVMILGASGTGKEMLAQAIHNASPRNKEPFVAVNFAALSPSLTESELFGYVEGAFTGSAKGGKKGLFEIADHGTIFLDEIGDCSLEVQKKILRVIQERNILPIGSNKLIPVDVRIIAATNKDLRQLIQEGEFREDLYYRLHVLPITIPSLCNRREDIIPLFLHFIQQFGVYMDSIPERLEDFLRSHPWHGNVRELRNAAEYLSACILSDIPWQETLDELFDTTGKTDTQQSPEEEASYPLLESSCDPYIVCQILAVLLDRKERWTRKKIASALEREAISENSIKYHLAIMKDHNLVGAKTGYGTYITESGMRFYQTHSNNAL